jgi:hypothetical protein
MQHVLAVGTLARHITIIASCLPWRRRGVDQNYNKEELGEMNGRRTWDVLSNATATEHIWDISCA